MAMEPLTLHQTIETAAAHHDAVSAEIKTPEIRVYETKTSQVLANGEIREYTIKPHYVVKKKTGICKTELTRRNHGNVTQSRNTTFNTIKGTMPTIERQTICAW